MAELILTEEEKEAFFWTDLDDDALGKLVKKKMLLIEASKQMDQAITFSAAMLICCAASEANEDEAEYTITGLTQEGRDFGDWIITARKILPNAKLRGVLPVDDGNRNGE